MVYLELPGIFLKEWLIWMVLSGTDVSKSWACLNSISRGIVITVVLPLKNTHTFVLVEFRFPKLGLQVTLSRAC